MADDARRREMDRLRRLAIEGDEEARRELEAMEVVGGGTPPFIPTGHRASRRIQRTDPGDKPVGAGRTLRRPEPVSEQELEARQRSRRLPPVPPGRTPVRRLLDDLTGEWEEGGTRASQELGRENLADMERQNASITRIWEEKARLAAIDEKTRADALALQGQHHQRNLRVLEERGTEQDPAAAREFLDRESERVGVPGLRTPEERKIAHGTYSPSDPTGLEGRMLGLVPEEPEPRRLTARERSQLGQGVADPLDQQYADATGQFERRNVGFATPGTENERGVRYEESRDMPGATRVIGPRQARLEDLLSEAEEMEFTGDTAGAASARGRVEGIRGEQAADMDRQRFNTRRSRNARDLTSALAMSERSRPGGVEMTADERDMVAGMTPAQRDRMTVKRARARGRGRRDIDQRESQRQAWNAEALRRDPSLLESIGGKPMTEFQRASLRESGRDRDETRDRYFHEDRRSREREAEASQRGDEAKVREEKKWQAQLHRWDVEDRRAKEETTTATRRYKKAEATRITERGEDKEEAARVRARASQVEAGKGKQAYYKSILDNPDASEADKDEARRGLKSEALNPPGTATEGPDTLLGALSERGGPDPATPATPGAPGGEAYKNDWGYKRQEALLSEQPPMGDGREKFDTRQKLVLKLRRQPSDEQKMLRDLYSDRWKGTFFADSGTWADWAERHGDYAGYSNEELRQFYMMEAPREMDRNEDEDDWHVYGRGGTQSKIDYNANGRRRISTNAQLRTWVPREKSARAGLVDADIDSGSWGPATAPRPTDQHGNPLGT